MTKKTTVKRKTAKPNKGAAMLKKITNEAKRIYKASPSKKWTNCIKEAAKKVKK